MKRLMIISIITSARLLVAMETLPSHHHTEIKPYITIINNFPTNHNNLRNPRIDIFNVDTSEDILDYYRNNPETTHPYARSINPKESTTFPIRTNCKSYLNCRDSKKRNHDSAFVYMYAPIHYKLIKLYINHRHEIKSGDTLVFTFTKEKFVKVQLNNNQNHLSLAPIKLD